MWVRTHCRIANGSRTPRIVSRIKQFPWTRTCVREVDVCNISTCTVVICEWLSSLILWCGLGTFSQRNWLELIAVLERENWEIFYGAYMQSRLFKWRRDCVRWCTLVVLYRRANHSNCVILINLTFYLYLRAKKKSNLLTFNSIFKYLNFINQFRVYLHYHPVIQTHTHTRQHT